MKMSFFVAITAGFLSVSAMAQHEAGGVQSRPVENRELITHVSHNGFMMPHVVERLEIRTNGTVTLHTWTTTAGGRTESQKYLGRIAASQILDLIIRIDAITDNLIDLNDGEPYCTDAPAWSDSIRYSTGDTVTVGKWSGCHNYRNEDAEFVKNIVDGWLAVAGIN